MKIFGLLNKHVLDKRKTQTLDGLNKIFPVKEELIDTLNDIVYILPLFPQDFCTI